MPRLLTADELVLYVEAAAKEVVKKPNVPNFPWTDPDSDHLPVFFNDAGGLGLKIGSWNCLCKSYIKWLQPRIVDGVDLSQRLWHRPFARPDEQKAREERIAVRLLDYVFKENMIMCVQELSGSVISIMQRKLKERNGLRQDDTVIWNLGIFKSLEPDINDSEDVDDDCYTAIIWNGNYIETTERMGRLKVEGVKDEPAFVVLRTPTHGNFFRILNVHVKFGTNEAHAQQYLKMFRDDRTPTVICGDFNCSSRHPMRADRGDHLAKCYSNPHFMFAPPGLPGYTHVNTFENTRNTMFMADKFDYIMMINYAFDPTLPYPEFVGAGEGHTLREDEIPVDPTQKSAF